MLSLSDTVDIQKFCLFFQVSQYRRANVTYEIYLYEDATWILPESIVEFREVLDQPGIGMSNTYACSSSYLRATSSHLWGTVVGDKAHLLVSTG